MDIFSAPFCFSGVRSTFGHCGDMMMMMMIDILEKLRKSHYVEERPPQSFASCQNRVVSTVRACHGTQTKTSASWVNSSIRLHTLKTWHFFAQFFSKNFRLFLRIIDALDEWWWLSRERDYVNNIRKVLKYFQKQRVWWEHRNILEKLEISEFFPRI